MSRREDRISESKRHRSLFERETSPKRSRRDGKPETERPFTEPELEKEARVDRDHRHHRRLQDSLPLEAVPKVESVTTIKRSSDPSRGPLSRSYFHQHDDRGGAGQNGRSFTKRIDSERGWWRDHKELQSNRAINKTLSSDAQQKDEKSKDNREGSHVWRHDGYYEMESNPRPPVRKRPAFREQKIPSDFEKTNKPAMDSVMPNTEDLAVGRGRRNDRGYDSRSSDKFERPAGGRELNKQPSWGGYLSSRDRYNSNGKFTGSDRFNGRQRPGYQSMGGHVEKWKHDLFNEANKSPPRKNEEDQISKIESLLAS